MFLEFLQGGVARLTTKKLDGAVRQIWARSLPRILPQGSHACHSDSRRAVNNRSA